MRTIKRYSRRLNRSKWSAISDIARSYASEKDKWFCELSHTGNTEKLSSDRIQRDILVKSRYQSLFGLQARQWKLALKDAVETLDKNWQALFASLSPLIYNNTNLSDAQRHYCYWILKSYAYLKMLLMRDYPIPDFKISPKDIKKAGSYLNRIIRKHRGRNPSVKGSRSFCLDQNMYTVFEENNTQYISIMTLSRGKRLIIPLLGRGVVSGNIRIILNRNKHMVEVHQTANIKAKRIPESNPVEAIDFGYTEAFTDIEGKTYGEGLGKILTAFSDKLDRTGKSRNKLHALKKKYRREGNNHKATHIRKFNLGFKKKDRIRYKAQASVSNKINNGFNTLIKNKKPSVLVTEDLRHVFTFNKPKNINRKLSAWTKGIIQDRAEFKALEGCSLHKQVNPAYGSQTCPLCGFVWNKSRNGDVFKCAFCGHGAGADRVAAINYLHRYSEPAITLYMPYRTVKEVFMERFLRRLECSDSVSLPSGLAPETTTYILREWESLKSRLAENGSERTVLGRTPDTGELRTPDCVGDVNRRQAGGLAAVTTAPVNRRAKQASIPEAKT
ncbi:MAG: transposase [Nitrospirae bacterium]|nr:transposase [Nitrospirota bacterium]